MLLHTRLSVPAPCSGGMEAKGDRLMSVITGTEAPILLKLSLPARRLRGLGEATYSEVRKQVEGCGMPAMVWEGNLVLGD